MAFVLKEGETFRVSLGLLTDSAYGVIDEPQVNKKSKEAMITMNIYMSKEERETTERIIDNINCFIKDEEYDTYFGDLILKEANKNIYTQAYVALWNKKLDQSIWESDEE
jgi:hypothetical protein